MCRHDALGQFSHLCLVSSPARCDARGIGSAADNRGTQRRWFARATALIAPPRCMLCLGDCAAHQQICSGCQRGLQRSKCGVDIARQSGALDRIFAAHDYSGLARDAVKALKYSGRTRMASTIAELIATRLPEGLIAPSCALVPVPAHPSNSRARGFNQSLLIANALGELIDVPVLDCLIRNGLGQPQSQLSRKDRLMLPAGEFAFAAKRVRHAGADPLAEFPTNVVVCDDVTTTTCTLEACASAIRERHSVQTIHGLAFASASL